VEDAIPVIADLFAADMKYLHDNGFDVIPMSDLI